MKWRIADLHFLFLLNLFALILAISLRIYKEMEFGWMKRLHKASSFELCYFVWKSDIEEQGR